ncbi:MAG: undecaprenyl-diphosphate phosphatase [Synergistetes bacterium]|nr:undecaprenyl-diphosphate phosphatase [Synergistota bacterium]MCX8127360.1 undecaprenyl-diphosphate phosphatase [Synergistota bacterium]MDW8192224.1 undecaprenyl-diphosphate phosphatase [Synergistota bacterium]
MKIFDAFVLGAIQGLTEFLPISSSGHLLIVEKLLNVEGDLLFLNVLFHAGSLVALLILFKRMVFSIIKGFFLKDEYFRRLGWSIIGALIPTGIIGVLLEKKVESISLKGVALFYFITAIFLFSLKYLGGIRDLKGFSFKDGFFVGIAQGMGVFPGLSRSGVTIFSGSFLGLDMDSAIRFSFLLAIPTIGGAFLFELKDIISLNQRVDWLVLLVGFVSSFFFSFLAIKLLMRSFIQKNLHWFSLYCLVLGLVLLLMP